MSIDTISEKIIDGILIITLRKGRENAIDHEMCVHITNVFNDAAINKEISMVVLTGAGYFFSSGFDVCNSNLPCEELFTIVQAFLKALATFPKLMIAIVNGPAIGIAATILALCDYAFASEQAYFYTPVATLGELGEACFSVTFPRLIGENKAMDMLLSNYKMLASEALDSGLVCNVYNMRDLHKMSWDIIKDISKLLQKSMLHNKKRYVNYILWSKINEKFNFENV